ncbi:minor capsid protein [Streptomyces mutabilis]|uniref:minor capsid protein n=1 Tax=Streptomyces mutabilis TaxID=67332 RepID=UPI0022BA6662|nr:minor capsid protein [Streptomyces mutabilis]MCZ9348545.1 minor capsid protein [Streptomyces mutabilis]
MADLTDGIARYLDSLDLLTYDPTGVTGDTFVGTMPARPDRAVSLTLYGAATTDARDDADVARMQIRVRGDADPRTSERRCLAIRDALHGLAGVELPDGTWLVLATAPRPSPMGADTNGRHEHVTNAAIDYAAPTPTP